jgi:hypothetical protein
MSRGSNIIDFRLVQMKALTRQIGKARAAGDTHVLDERLAEAELVFNSLKETRFGQIDLTARIREEF